MGKRGNNEGSIRKRPDGLWEARITLPDGKRPSFYGNTREEVRKKLNEAIRNRDKDLPVVSVRQTVREFLIGKTKHGEDNYPGGWLGVVKPNVKPKTYISYEGHVRLHILPELEKVQIARLTPQHLQTLYAKKLESGLSPTTVSHIHATIHTALEQAVRWGVVFRNVAELVDRPRRAKHEMLYLSPEEARRFLEAASGDRLEALYVVGVTTGMRQGELLGLHWRDVDLDHKILHVTSNLQYLPKQGMVFSDPKTAAGKRPIALTDLALEAIRRHKVRQAEERLKTGPAWQDNDLVFCNGLGKPLEAANLVKRHFKPLLAKAGIPAIRFHDLRHTAATLCLKAKVPPKVVSEMLGHSQVSVTMNVYSHVMPDMQRDATAALDAVLGG